jgi:hypothetical protein
MNQEVQLREGAQLDSYDPAKGLKLIDNAAEGERRARRAKDAGKLFEAIEAKLAAQAEYVCWRDSVPRPPHAGPGRGRKNQVSAWRRCFPEGDPGDKVVHKWRKRLCHKGRGSTVVDLEKMRQALEDAQQYALRICEQQTIGLLRGTQGTGDNEWWTPEDLVEMAREALGAIDLDPATTAEANKIVRAGRVFTKQDDGLKHEWHGRIWLNPPYSQPLIEEFVSKMVSEYAAGRTTAAGDRGANRLGIRPAAPMLPRRSSRGSRGPNLGVPSADNARHRTPRRYRCAVNGGDAEVLLFLLIWVEAVFRLRGLAVGAIFHGICTFPSLCGCGCSWVPFLSCEQVRGVAAPANTAWIADAPPRDH